MASLDNTQPPSFFDGVQFRDLYTSVGGVFVQGGLAADYGLQLTLSQAVAVAPAGALVTSGNYYVGLAEGFGTVINNSAASRTFGAELRVVRTFDAATVAAQSAEIQISSGNLQAFNLMFGVGFVGGATGALNKNFVVQLWLIALNGVAGDLVLKSSFTWTTNTNVGGVRLRLWPQYQGVVQV